MPGKEFMSQISFLSNGDSVVQGSFTAKAISGREIIPNYVSAGIKQSLMVKFKFSINGAENSAPREKTM